MEQTNQQNQPQERLVGIKSWIKSIVNGEYIVKEGWEPNYIQYNEHRISRANIMGIVVQKSDSQLLNYEYLVIDDGSGRITARSFEENEKFEDFNVGDTVNIIGRPREFGREIYIMPEIVRKLKDNRWLEVRKLELGEMPEKEQENKPRQEIEVEDIETPQERLIKTINSMDDGSGVDIDEVITKTGKPRTEEILKDMLAQGDIFEIKPGRVKVLE